MRVASFTVAAIDFFSQQNEYFAGGNALNQAVRFSQMGFDCSFLGALGTDKSGDRIEDLLASHKIDLSMMQRIKGKTASNELINDSKGERFGVDGAWNNGVYMDYQMTKENWNAIKDFEIWSTHANGPFYNEVLMKKTNRNFLVVDFLHLQDYELVRSSLDIADIIYFGGTRDMESKLSELAKNSNSILVLTLGAEGSIAFHKDKVYFQKALEVAKVIDTTGCGDAFQAGFTASYYKYHDIKKALLSGAELGRAATQSFGGVPWN